MSAIVLVFGGRDYNDEAFFDAYMDKEHGVYVLSHVIHGAYRGADTLADRWAKKRGVQPVACAANWDLHGRRAGPLRNTAMIALRPEWAYGFPGGDGTADMARKLEAAGIEVTMVEI